MLKKVINIYFFNYTLNFIEGKESQLGLFIYLSPVFSEMTSVARVDKVVFSDLKNKCLNVI